MHRGLALVVTIGLTGCAETPSPITLVADRPGSVMPQWGAMTRGDCWAVAWPDSPKRSNGLVVGDVKTYGAVLHCFTPKRPRIG